MEGKDIPIEKLQQNAASDKPVIRLSTACETIALFAAGCQEIHDIHDMLIDVDNFPMSISEREDWWKVRDTLRAELEKLIPIWVKLYHDSDSTVRNMVHEDARRIGAEVVSALENGKNPLYTITIGAMLFPHTKEAKTINVSAILARLKA